MSPERARHSGRTLRLGLIRPPSAAALAPAPREGQRPLDAALARLLARREAAARAAGEAAGRAELEQSLGRALEAALARLDADRDEAATQLARTAVELALEIARTLLRLEIPAGRYDLEAIVREALACSETGRGDCVVHVNPLDAERLTRVPFRAGTELEADHGVPRGSVHVTTPQGLLVRDLDLALDSIRERLLGGLA